MVFIKAATDPKTSGPSQAKETKTTSGEDKPKASSADRFPSVDGLLQDIEATFSRRQFAL